MLKTLAGVGISMAALVAPASAASPDQIYEFTVITDTVETRPCGHAGDPPCFQEGPVPYKLATLTLTHEALTKHEAACAPISETPAYARETGTTYGNNQAAERAARRLGCCVGKAGDSYAREPLASASSARHIPEHGRFPAQATAP